MENLILEKQIERFLEIDVGSGDGSGSGYGSGYSDGYGDGIKTFDGDIVYQIDNTPTIITAVRGNAAQGYVLQSDFTLKPCYIVKDNNKFAHGDTLHDAMTSLQEKLYDDSTTEERIAAFLEKFPDYDTPYAKADLFVYHHVLTGSCRFGREAFCRDEGIDMSGVTTVRQFVELTKDAYGGEIVRQLAEHYS